MIWLQLTESLYEYSNDQLAELRSYVRPVLPGGVVSNEFGYIGDGTNGEHSCRVFERCHEVVPDPPLPDDLAEQKRNSKPIRRPRPRPAATTDLVQDLAVMGSVIRDLRVSSENDLILVLDNIKWGSEHIERLERILRAWMDLRLSDPATCPNYVAPTRTLNEGGMVEVTIDWGGRTPQFDDLLATIHRSFGPELRVTLLDIDGIWKARSEGLLDDDAAAQLLGDD
jgi:hypothetical protein